MTVGEDPTARTVAPVAAARTHLLRRHAAYGLTATQARQARVTSVVPLDAGGSVVYLQQRVDGIDVSHAMLNVAVTAQGTVAPRREQQRRQRRQADQLDHAQADRRRRRPAGPRPRWAWSRPRRSPAATTRRGADHARELSDGGISMGPIPAQLVYERTDDGDLRLSWELVIDQLDGQHWWQIRMDARTGAELGRTDWVAADSHRVFPIPVESPSFGPRSLESNPATSASPFGWNDTNGAAGA